MEAGKILSKIKAYMEQQHMVKAGCHIIAGVSGGADSMCMLYALLELGGVFGYTLSVVHVEHGIRGEESKRDAAFVRQFCECKGIACKVFAYDVPEYAKAHGMGEEEAGRHLRYASFDAEKEKYPGREVKVAVAHNLNDNAETMLFNLARGSSLRGLCGIAPVRGDIIRPLLTVSRQEVEACLKSLGQQYCTDSTNRSGRYSRNRIRMEALPALLGVNSLSIRHMYQTAEEMRELAQYIETEAKKCLEGCAVYKNGGSCAYIPEKQFGQAGAVLQKEMLYQLIAGFAGGSKDITGVHIRQLMDLFVRQNGRKVQLPYGILAERVYGGIEIGRPAGEETGEDDGPRFSFRVFKQKFQTEPEISENKYTKWFDYDKIKSGLCIRHRMPGDYLAINDAGERQKLKKYLINEKVPAKERDQIPLLAEGAHILWIVGYRISSYYKVEKHTKRILEVTFTEERKKEVVI